MVKFTVSILGACIFIAQAAPYEDGTLYRVIRSPHYGPRFHDGPYVPFPPFFYHTHNWSGVARGRDNIPRGAFSGAAASVQGPAPASNTAFSLAASETDDDDCDDDSSEFKGSAQSSGNYDSKLLQSNSQSSGRTSGFAVHTGAGSGERQLAGYGHGSLGNSAESLNYNGNLGTGSRKFSQSEQFTGSQDFGQQSNLGDGGKSSGFSSEYHAGNPDSFGGSYRKSYREFHHSVHKEGDKAFESPKDSQVGGFGGNGKSYSSEFSNSHLSSSKSNGSPQGLLNSNSNAFGPGFSGHTYGHSKDHNFGSSNYQTGESETLNSQQSQSSTGFGKNKESDSDALVNTQSQTSASENNGGLTASSSQGSIESGQKSYSSGSFGHADGYSKSHGFGSSNYKPSESGTLDTQQSQLNGDFDANKQFASGSLTSSQTQISSSEKSGGLTVGSTQGFAASGSGAYGSGHGFNQYDGKKSINSQQSQLSGIGQFNSNENTQSSSFGNADGSVGSGSNGYVSESSKQGYRHSANHGFGSANIQAGEKINNDGLAVGSTQESSDSGASTFGVGFTGHKQDYSRDQIGYLSQGQGQHQSALKGALELASQGIQASEKSECSTCQKGGYALSNAKSYSGSAIALAIGG